MHEVRWNLIAFGVLLAGVLGAVLWFASSLLTPNVVKGNEELVIGAVVSLVSSALGGIVGYAIGVQQALTAPPGGKDKMTEETALKLAGKE